MFSFNINYKIFKHHYFIIEILHREFFCMNSGMNKKKAVLIQDSFLIFSSFNL